MGVSKAFGLIKRAIGGGVGAKEVFEQVTKGADSLNFSNQERSVMNMQAADAMSEFVKATLSENTARSLTRRYIAILFMCFFTVWVTIVLITTMFNVDLALKMVSVLERLKTPQAFITIIAFFFGSYLLRKVIPQKEKKNRNETRKESKA